MFSENISLALKGGPKGKSKVIDCKERENLKDHRNILPYKSMVHLYHEYYMCCHDLMSKYINTWPGKDSAKQYQKY